MNCPQCQTVISPGSAYCGNCGTRITAPRQPGDQAAAGHNAAVPPVRFDHTRLAPADKIALLGYLAIPRGLVRRELANMI